MANYKYDPQVETVGDGSLWSKAKRIKDFKSDYATGVANDHFYFGADPQYQHIEYTGDDTIRLNNNSGTNELAMYVMAGEKGNQINTNLINKCFVWCGTRHFPYHRELSSADDGGVFMELFSDYHIVSGFQIKNYSSGLWLKGSCEGSVISDWEFENVEYCIRSEISTPLSNVTFENIHAKQVGFTLIRLEDNVSNINIRNFSIFGRANETTTFRGINIRNNHSNVTIENGVVRGAINGYGSNNLPDDDFGYNQGDGISLEIGSNTIIRRVTCSDCTDRAFDVKADVLYEDCTALRVKIGMAAWNDGVFNRCVVSNLLGNSNNEGIGLQCLGTSSNYEINECKVTLINKSYVNYKKQLAIFANGTIVVNGGEYIVPDGQIFLLSKADNTNVTLNNVKINGKYYTASVTLGDEEEYNPQTI